MEAAIEEDDVDNEVLMLYYIVLVYPSVSLCSANWVEGLIDEVQEDLSVLVLKTEGVVAVVRPIVMVIPNTDHFSFLKERLVI